MERRGKKKASGRRTAGAGPRGHCPAIDVLYESVSLGDVPDKGTDSVFLVHVVEPLDVLEDEGHHVLLDDGEGGGVHLGPRVGAHAGLAAVGARPVDEGPLGEARDAELVEHIADALGEGLVVYDHYCF